MRSSRISSPATPGARSGALHYDDDRVLVIGTMIALAQWDEFRLHVRAALAEGGFSEADIKEVILQQAIYFGVRRRRQAMVSIHELKLEKRIEIVPTTWPHEWATRTVEFDKEFIAANPAAGFPRW